MDRSTRPPATAPGAEGGDFAAAVAAISNAFGDPTRRDIYLFVAEHAEGVTATATSDRFALHPNVARHHLQKLVDGGYVMVDTERHDGAVGRPSKRYRTVEARASAPLAIAGPLRKDDVLVTLLGRALAMLPREHAERMAEEVGVEYGRVMAAGVADSATAQHSFRSALHAVAEALTEHGFAAHAEKRGGKLRIVSETCPFGDAVIDHPVICAVDRGMVRGLLETLWGANTRADIDASLPMGADRCITNVTTV